MILAPVFYDGAVELVIEATPSSFYEDVAGGLGTTTGSVTVTVNGAVPFSITWVSDTSDLEATSPNSATTTFDYSGLPSILESVFSTSEITVMDAYGNSATAYYSAAVTRTS
jgi:hypothetical protein